MIEARVIDYFDGLGPDVTGVIAECHGCNWSRTYEKATVRQAYAFARRHFHSTHGLEVTA